RTSDSPSGRYLRPRSKRRPLMMSRSISQRIFLDASMLRTYFAMSAGLMMAFIAFLHLARKDGRLWDAMYRRRAGAAMIRTPEDMMQTPNPAWTPWLTS